jgi:hypothetical protein
LGPALFLPFLAAAGCWQSYAELADGPRDDAGAHDDTARPDDARTDDARADDSGSEVTGAAFYPDTEGPAPGTLWLAAESVTADTLILLVMAATAEPSFGVAARLRYDPSILTLRSASSCGDFDRAGFGAFSFVEQPAGGTVRESWFGVASASHDAPVEAAPDICAIRAVFSIVGTGATRVDLVPGRSAAVGVPATRLVATAIAGGRLEVMP